MTKKKTANKKTINEAQKKENELRAKKELWVKLKKFVDYVSKETKNISCAQDFYAKSFGMFHGLLDELESDLTNDMDLNDACHPNECEHEYLIAKL
jgi:hypothetical protein